MQPENFPILFESARGNKVFFNEALANITQGVASGTIRNSVLTEAKHTLSSVANDAWKRVVEEPFFYAGKYKEQPQAVEDLNSSIMIMGLHDVISASKKVAKSQATGPAVDAMRSFCAEVLPLSLAVASLKDKVIKGRAPSTGPSQPANPKKLIKTCPVCFRAIALTGATMAHHGYKRPGEGSQTASCPGIRFQPLEVSSDGLSWLISSLRKRYASLREDFDARGTKESLQVRKAGTKKEFETITPNSPAWSRLFRAYVERLEFEIDSMTREIVMLDKKLKDWQPEGSH